MYIAHLTDIYQYKTRVLQESKIYIYPKICFFKHFNIIVAQNGFVMKIAHIRENICRNHYLAFNYV